MSVIILLFFSLTIFSGCINTTNDDGGHNFKITLLDGSTKNLKDFRGKIVIVDFWAIWCGYCTFQMVELKKLYDHYSQGGIEILSINVELSESSDMIYDYIEDFKSQYNIELEWIIAQDDGTIWQNYMIENALPTLYIFNQEGKIHFSHIGLSFFNEIPEGFPDTTPLLKDKIDELL